MQKIWISGLLVGACLAPGKVSALAEEPGIAFVGLDENDNPIELVLDKKSTSLVSMR